MSKVDVHDGLAELISQAATEDLAVLEPETIRPDEARKLVNHPWAIVFSWLLCLSVSVFYYLEPLPKQHDLGIRSVETRLNVAMYHVAHHVESFRNETGHLPDYLEDGWNESDSVEYRIGSDGYELIGRSGELELVYLEGQDPEGLIHAATKKAGSP
jgi:hypothetical protein